MRFLAALLLAGCGYVFVQTGRPFKMQRIAVVPFAELEAVGMTGEVARALVQDLAASGVEVVTDKLTADGVLTGTIQGTSVISSPVRDVGTVKSFRVRLVLSAQLEDRAGKSVWTTSLSEDEDFLPGSDAVNTETNRREALRRLAARAAQRLYDELALAGALGA